MKKRRKKRRKTVERVTISLTLAKKKDFFVFSEWKDNGGKIFKPAFGLPYWLKNSKGEIEEYTYILTESTDLDSFAEYCEKKQVYISKEFKKWRKKKYK